MESFCRQRSLRIIGSQLIEDGINRIRKSEGDGVSAAMANERVWASLVVKDVLGNVHRYSEARCSEH